MPAPQRLDAADSADGPGDGLEVAFADRPAVAAQLAGRAALEVLQRLFVESAARKVLDSVEASVLVVRAPVAHGEAGAAQEEAATAD